MGHTRGAVEVAKTVLEVADLAWSAVESLHHHHHHENPNPNPNPDNPNQCKCSLSAEELEDIRKENRRLRELLEQNLMLLQNISASPCFRNDCPPDLHERIVAAVDSRSFLSRLQSLQSDPGNGNEFPFKKATEVDLESAEILINVGREEPSWWVWVSDDMVRGTEERSGLDDENYVIVREEHVVDGVANFIARCIVSNPKLQVCLDKHYHASSSIVYDDRWHSVVVLTRLILELAENDSRTAAEDKPAINAVTSSLGGLQKVEKMLNIWHAGMLFYCLSTWGLALAGLYHSRAVLKVAAHGVHHASKLVVKAL
ncbi:hypothetical protein Cgig2_029480 [Carnegiea gigantea]|uniref:Uncharacterized protein n=1 Tax=Carnegiea gigantea TaxID=171969 RepID=A0A9Q1QJN5_9CARY|nr:hypothetical protein Cgig2_029480 [Carnegiea gigantea]